MQDFKATVNRMKHCFLINNDFNERISTMKEYLVRFLQEILQSSLNNHPLA